MAPQYMQLNFWVKKILRIAVWPELKGFRQNDFLCLTALELSRGVPRQRGQHALRRLKKEIGRVMVAKRTPTTMQFR